MGGSTFGYTHSPNDFRAMSINNTQVSIYCQGTFDIANPSAVQQQQMLADATELATSGFGTVILGQWHVHPNGDVYYNDTLFTPGSPDLNWSLSTIPAAIKKGARYVLVTFGPFGSDFDAITANLASFQQTVQYLFDNYNIDGIDFDIEGSYTTENQQTLTTLTEWAIAQGKIVTGAPYTEMSWWQSLLMSTKQSGWWNLQVYASGNYEPMYGEWVTGVPVDPSFLTYGFKPADGSTQAVILSTLQQVSKQYPTVGGAFIWRYEDIKGQAAAYHWAILRGLGFVGPVPDNVKAAEAEASPVQQ